MGFDISWILLFDKKSISYALSKPVNKQHIVPNFNISYTLIKRARNLQFTISDSQKNLSDAQYVTIYVKKENSFEKHLYERCF